MITLNDGMTAALAAYARERIADGKGNLVRDLLSEIADDRVISRWITDIDVDHGPQAAFYRGEGALARRLHIDRSELKGDPKTIPYMLAGWVAQDEALLVDRDGVVVARIQNLGTPPA